MTGVAVAKTMSCNVWWDLDKGSIEGKWASPAYNCDPELQLKQYKGEMICLQEGLHPGTVHWTSYWGNKICCDMTHDLGYDTIDVTLFGEQFWKRVEIGTAAIKILRVIIGYDF